VVNSSRHSSRFPTTTSRRSLAAARAAAWRRRSSAAAWTAAAVHTDSGEPQIYIEPQASDENAWWHASQVDNILAALDTVKRRYNVDETQTYLTGISDGGTGTYFFALREPNLWSACMTINGQPLVLSNRDARIEGNLYLATWRIARSMSRTATTIRSIPLSPSHQSSKR
jgi:hypothetical protein